MDLFANLFFGFGVALSLQNLLYCLIGVLVGTLIGVLPGIGPLGTIAMLMPLTYGVPPVAALIMLAGIYYGAQYGGSTTAILVNLPGETSAVVTCIDGYQMARQGRAGPALAIAAPPPAITPARRRAGGKKDAFLSSTSIPEAPSEPAKNTPVARAHIHLMVSMADEWSPAKSVSAT